MGPKKKDPKKKGEEETVGYNIDIMTTEELKRYAYNLENGIEEMRKNCNFYQTAESELADFCRIRQDELESQEDLLLKKAVNMEQLKDRVREDIQKRRQEQAYNEYAYAKHENTIKIETENQIQNAAKKHEEEQSFLKASIQERERELQAEELKMQMNIRDILEKNEAELANVDEYEKQLLEKAVESFKETLSNVNSEFHLALSSIESEALESKRLATKQFQNACSSFKEKLHEYYKNVTQGDLATINDLEQKIKDLHANIERTQSQLDDIVKENDKLAAKNQKKVKIRQGKSEKDTFNIGDSKRKKCLRDRRRMERLTRENKILAENILKVEEEIDNLRSNFVRVLCKVRESTEMKAVFLEKKLHGLISNSFNDNDQEYSSNSEDADSKRYSDN